MIRLTLLYLFFLSFSLSSYLPMSQKKHNFGPNVCRYYDHEDQIDYVRPCEHNKFCEETETYSTATTMNKLHTCQEYIEIPENSKLEQGQECEKDDDCFKGLKCIIGSDSKKNCDFICPEGQHLYKIYRDEYEYECRYNDDKCYFIKDNIPITYTCVRCKACGKINSVEKKDSNNNVYKVMIESEQNDRFSQEDGTFVLDVDACSSLLSLYFYLDGKTVNEIDSTYSWENKMYPRCISIKAVDYKNGRLNYTIGTDTVYIYDINKVQFDDVDSDGNSEKKNEMIELYDKILMPQAELWNNNREAFMGYYDSCRGGTINDALLRKIYYFEHPVEYLLYKDQTEVMEYLIQKEFPEIVPIIQKSEDSAGFISYTYIILSLMLLFI